MAQDGEGQIPRTVTALRRPPVRQSVLVRSDQRHTFDTFVDTIGIWWPVTPFSAGRDRVAVEHRGWEQLTDEELARDCALPGGYLGGAYREGWSRILGRFAVAIAGQ
jgi:hypothetical protein